ncbi:hypothetical protein EVAR_84881_1 [Eumeta japonica]|uniref:Mariner Mos1 transposase n=1 Tax=Eumeta variegata TaxID=151549 RepID=A0A4C1YJE3_EUMVA|nr:hypothetical protein EVAR_84881_1 [Eumeta japonica]
MTAEEERNCRFLALLQKKRAGDKKINSKDKANYIQIVIFGVGARQKEHLPLLQTVKRYGATARRRAQRKGAGVGKPQITDPFGFRGHGNNVYAYSAFKSKNFLNSALVKLVSYPSYSPDLISCDIL